MSNKFSNLSELISVLYLILFPQFFTIALIHDRQIYEAHGVYSNYLRMYQLIFTILHSHIKRTYIYLEYRRQGYSLSYY